MRIAVFGAGPAGLISIKHALDYGCEVTAFELNDKVGGTWVYSDFIGKNKFGIDVHSSMYGNLVTNLPIEMMCYPNEPFPENEVSFVSSEVVLNYYESFSDKYKLRDHIKFEHEVVRVRPIADESWEVLVRNLKESCYETLKFDGILICTGHFHSGFIPAYEGRKEFEGKQIHSHDYRSPEVFKSEKILLIGGNFSAVDIVQQTSKHAESITWSHHLKDQPDLQAFGLNVTQKPDVARLIQNGAEFIDGSNRDFTVIIYCTGYEYKFPFLSVDCGISTHEDYVKPLYKHCLNINHPTMSFIGLPNLICPNQLFSLQARFSLAFMIGEKETADKEGNAEVSQC
jgi:dimethylaniline monooxygenase (N-oxide forming)